MKRELIIGAIALASLGGTASAEIKVTKARIGCLDIQLDANITDVVGRACNTRESCSFKAPEPSKPGYPTNNVRTRSFCTQGMEIVYLCNNTESHTVMVAGDAWNHPAAELTCKAAPPPEPHGSRPDVVNVRAARIGCLDIQQTPNLTGMVGAACNGKQSCSFPAPDEAKYKAAGVKAATRTFCTQAMEITYDCGRDDPRTAFVPGDAWRHPPAKLACAPVPAPSSFDAGEAPIKITSARIGCLDLQKTGNLTRLVGAACNGRGSCTFAAPTPDQYARAGVTAATRTMCTQAMEIKYRCGANDDQVARVRGDAWNQPPARLVCDGRTIATNRQDVTPPAGGTAAEPMCVAPKLGPTDYFIAPKHMLDWSKVPDEEIAQIIKHAITSSDIGQMMSGFKPPPQPTADRYPARPADVLRSPSTIGGHEGRLRQELRAVAAKRDALGALCEAAKRFTSDRPASGDTPSDRDFGTAFADLAVTGKNAFTAFKGDKPDDAKLKARCPGASDAAIARALDRAYAVAAAVRKDHKSAERQRLGWVAVSGEDDQPYRPINVPSTKYPQFDARVEVPKFRIPINTRYMIAHRTAPAAAPGAVLVDGGSRKVPGDPVPALAPDAEVILFVHGMDSRVEEAEQLTDALRKLPGKRNWVVIAFDLPTSGYADNIDHGRISPIAEVGCHKTPLLDFLEEYVVSFVDTVDAQLRGQLKPKIKAVVGGSLGGNLSLRLGRRSEPWIRSVVPWSPAAIWPSYVGRQNTVAGGCDTGWDAFKDISVNVSLTWGGRDPFFGPGNELTAARRASFYGGFDWAPVGGLGGPPQAQCWLSDSYKCKGPALVAARLDRHETYDRFFRAWHWRLAAEQLAFSHQQFAEGTQTPLYLRNHKRTLLLCGYDDTCGKLCEYTRDVASKMVHTPGYARFMKQTGHSLDNEYPSFVARELDAFVEK
jgi:hypothetical protein